MSNLHMTETEFADTIIELAHWYGWQVAHFRPARTAKGWRTPMQGDVGFPDLVLARDGVVMFVELKSMGGRLSAGQKRWGEQLGAIWQVWRPTDLELAKQVLKRA